MICVAIVGICGCNKQESVNTIDWNLHGVWVTADGVVQNEQEGVDFSLSGTLPTGYDAYSTVEMKLNFIWPDGFIYSNEGTRVYTGGANFANKHENQSIYHGGEYVYSPEDNESNFLSYTICPEEGFIVVHVDNKYLVGSTDPNADPAEIFAFYKEYVYVS
ncbi:MAG: hypothetical protein IJY12_03540 [Clostridia bacterium]|nr:hypothetical protein [Clostridia bacterium]